jgi:hypothetical protein
MQGEPGGGRVEADDARLLGALLVGATPVLVAIVAALRHREVARPVAVTAAQCTAAAFGDPVGLVQATGAAILAGVALSGLPLLGSPTRLEPHLRGRALHAAGRRA